MAWLTLDPDIGSCHYGKHQQEHDEDKCLKIVGSHSLHSEQYGPQQLTLGGRGDERSITIIMMVVKFCPCIILCFADQWFRRSIGTWLCPYNTLTIILST